MDVECIVLGFWASQCLVRPSTTETPRHKGGLRSQPKADSPVFWESDAPLRAGLGGLDRSPEIGLRFAKNDLSSGRAAKGSSFFASREDDANSSYGGTEIEEQKAEIRRPKVTVFARYHHQDSRGRRQDWAARWAAGYGKPYPNVAPHGS